MLDWAVVLGLGPYWKFRMRGGTSPEIRQFFDAKRIY